MGGGGLSGWGKSAVTLDMIGKEDEDQNSHNPWKASEDQKRDRRLESFKRIKSKCLMNSGFCFLSIPVVFNNIQHPPRWRREGMASVPRSE